MAPRDGAVLPILHLNGYEIANPKVPSAMATTMTEQSVYFKDPPPSYAARNSSYSFRCARGPGKSNDDRWDHMQPQS